MEIPPEPEKSIKTSLSGFMDEHQAEQYMNLDYATSLVKQGQPPWQALVSVGVYAAELYVQQDTDAAKTNLQELVGQALEPVETLFQSILPKPSAKPLEGEKARLLFHIRFALGFLLLAKGDKARSKAILHDMAATRVSVRGHSHYDEGPGIVECTDDVRQVKFQTAISLLPEYLRQKDYYEILYLMTEVVACTPWATYMLDIVSVILDSCVAEYEKADYDVQPGLEWLWLFVEAGELLSLCEEYDSSGSVPNECKEESAQYMAWKIGQIAGRFAAKWNDDPFGKFQDFESAIGEKEYQSERGEEKTRQTIMVILSLLREYDPARDWQKMREQCLSIWELSDSCSGMPLSEIGPCHDLYWAMRIGFADTFLELQKGAKPTKIEQKFEDAISPKALSDIQDAMDRAYSNLKELVDRERQPPSKPEIVQQLQQRLSPVWNKLPATVVDTLVQAENYYRTGVHTNDAKMWFHKAVEASLNCCLVEPLVGFVQKQGEKRIAVCFPPPRGMERKTSSELRKLPLWEWSDVFETLSDPLHKNLASLGTEELKRFMKEHFGELPLPALRELSRSLRDFCQYRKDCAHYHIPRYEEEIRELELNFYSLRCFWGLFRHEMGILA